MIFTYDGILEELETKLSSLSEWKKTLFHGTYRRINSVIAYILEKIVYYADYLYQESSWDLATKRESLMARTEYYSYNPYRKKGASGVIELIGDPTWEIDSDYTFLGASVIIPQWSEFTDETGNVVVYSTEQITYYTNTLSSIEIPVKEGVPKQYIYTAKGNISEIINLEIQNTDNDEIEVYIVDNNDIISRNVTRCEIDIEDKLFFVQDLVNYYCSIKNNFTLDGVIITFGDGIKSRKLIAGERILIKYAETKGASGNITNSNVISKIKNELIDGNGESVTLYVRNTTAITNGSDEESLEDIRYNAPNLFNTGYRCGGGDDWKVILEEDSRIYKAITWSTDDEGMDDTITEDQNKVFVVAIGADGEALTETQQDDITINVLKPIKSKTEIVSWQPLKKVYARFDVTATITNIPFTQAELLINESLEAEYGVLHQEFKQSVYESNFYRVIDTVDIVNNHVTQLYHGEKLESSVYNHIIYPSVLASEDSDPLNQIYIKQNSLEIWGKFLSSGEITFNDPIRVGYCTGGAVIGTIVGDNGYTISGSAVVYNINSISYTVDELVSVAESDYELMVIYITENGNGDMTNDIRLTYFDLILDMDSDYNTYTLSYI